MRINTVGRGRARGGRRGSGFGLGSLRWLILVGFAIYAAFTWMRTAEVDPYTGETAHYGVEPTEEHALGVQAFDQVLDEAQAQGTLLPEESQASRQIEDIAERLIARVPDVSTDLARANGQAVPTTWQGFDWNVAVIQSPEANAFALPGGKMAVYTGLMPVAQNQDAMAVIMGHEIAHALLRHGSQRIAQQKLVQAGQVAAGLALGGMEPSQQQALMAALGAGAQYGFVLPYGRDHESQADRVGLMLAAAACYDPREAVGLWQRMSETGGGQRPPEFASTHPDPANRIRRLQALMPEAEAMYSRYCTEPLAA